MKSETNLARNILQTGAKSAYDAACKRLLANKIILAWIMKSCMEEYRDCDVSDIVEKYIEGVPQVGTVGVHPDETNQTINSGNSISGMRNEDVTLTEGTVTYDIRFWAAAPVSGELLRLIVNVEAQGNFYPGYPLIKRGIYYCSRMISAQYETEFSDSHYEEIKKVYSIWICMNPPKDKRNSITRYAMKEEMLIGNGAEKPVNYDLLTILMIYMGTPEDKNYSGVLKLLEVLLSSRMEAEEKKIVLREDFGIAMTSTMEREVSDMCNLSEVVERQGIEKGIEKGIVDANLAAIRNLMEALKLTAEQAMEVLRIPDGEREKYISRLLEDDLGRGF